MNARFTIFWPRVLRGSVSWIVLLMVAVLTSAGLASSFVYETGTEFFGNGDFNGDGRPDIVVLDKATGNARVGFQDVGGAIAWSTSIPSGVAHAGSMAVGRFLHTNRQSIAVTSLELNRVHVIDLSNPTNAPQKFNTPHSSLTMLVGLEAPYGTAGLPAQHLDWTSAGTHDPGITLLDLLAYSIGDTLASFQDQVVAEAYLGSGNSIQFGATATTAVAGMVRGSNDTFVAYSYAAQSNVLYRVGLRAGTEYAFGHFRWIQDTQPIPALLFYVPGESNIMVQRVLETVSGFTLSAPTTTSFTSAIQRVYFIDEGTNGSGVVQFGNGAVGVRPGGNDALHVTYGLGLGPAGNVITGFAPLGAGKFVMLSGGSNTFSSAQAQVFTKSGSNYVQTSSNSLPKVTSNGTRANIWLFAGEPFVTSNPNFVASLHGGDWITSLSGLPGTVSVIAETDRGVTNGLGNPAPQNLASPSLNATYGIANQYHPSISLFAYSAVRSAEPVLITISPPPGNFDDPINVSFATASPGDEVFYRLSAGAYQQYVGPFTLNTNTQVQFYGSVFGSANRSSLQLANYTFTPKPALLDTNAIGGGTTNPPPVPNVTNEIPAYAYGTIFYSRRSGSTGSIWSIHLDGSGDHFITEGVRPRLSPDGRYLAFLREGSPFVTPPVNNGNIWIRDLLNRTESRLITRTNLIVGFDWEYANTNLVFDHGCQILRTDLSGNVTPLPFVTGCSDDAPAISPLDGSMAFYNLGGVAASSGLWVTDPGVTLKQRLDPGQLKPRRPSWSPDGTQLAFAHYQFTTVPQSGQDLYVVNPDGTDLFQITGFRAVEGFREGALWTPDGDALIGAAVVGGVNGIWIVPLTPDRHACGSPPYRLPTTPGDLIDFVGTVFVPPPPPQLSIRREVNGVTVFWRRTAFPVVLETATHLSPGAIWTPVAGPFPIAGSFFEHFIPEAAFTAGQFYRLRLF